MSELMKSNAQYQDRATIFEALRLGRSPDDIIRTFKYPPATVYNIVLSKYPDMSLRKLAKIVGVSTETVNRITEEDVKYALYMIKIQQILSEAARTGRVVCCNYLRNTLNVEAAGRMIFFSDEKIFK